MIKTTPLYENHLKLRARMVPFAGYQMPISYDSLSGGMIKEHLRVRESVGMFDVSHMGEFWIRGPQATEFLNFLCTRGFSKLPDFKAQYCLLTTDRGTIVDDIIVYKWNSETYWMVVNASNITKDFSHINQLAKGFKVQISDVSEQTALIALQGPKAVEVISECLSSDLQQLKYYQFKSVNDDWIVGRTGYTGEDGFEVFLPASQAQSFWEKLESKGVLPIGLGARDTLRLEVGFPLYGHELSEDLIPSETFSGFAMDTNHDFHSKTGALRAPRWRPIAIYCSSPKPVREGDKLLIDGRLIGRITSGSTSPVRRVGIGLGLVETESVPTTIEKDFVFILESGGKQREAFFTQTPFVVTPRVKAAGKKENTENKMLNSSPVKNFAS